MSRKAPRYLQKTVQLLLGSVLPRTPVTCSLAFRAAETRDLFHLTKAFSGQIVFALGWVVVSIYSTALILKGRQSKGGARRRVAGHCVLEIPNFVVSVKVALEAYESHRGSLVFLPEAVRPWVFIGAFTLLQGLLSFIAFRHQKSERWLRERVKRLVAKFHFPKPKEQRSGNDGVIWWSSGLPENVQSEKPTGHVHPKKRRKRAAKDKEEYIDRGTGI
jgi:hypothetical protein